MQRNLLPALLPLLAILLLLLGSCAGGPDSSLSLDAAGDSELSGEAPAGGMPNLPAPLDLPRTASGLYAYERGTNYQNDLSALVADNGLMADFSPAYSGEGLDGLAYAVYVLLMKDYEGLGELEVKWATAPEEEDVYIGLSDYETNRWKWLRPPSSFKLQIPDFERYIKPNPDQRYMYVVVAVGGSEQCTLDLVRAGGNQAPVAKLEVSDSFGTAPLAVAFDASESFDAGGEIATFEWDPLGDGNYAESIGTFNYLYGSVGDYPMKLRITDNEGNQTVVTHHIVVVDGGQFDETEDNDDPQQADQLPSGSFSGFHGTVGPSGAEDGDSEDFFTFTISEPSHVALFLMFQHSDANVDVNVYHVQEDEFLDSVGVADSMDDDEELGLSLMPGKYVLRVWNRDVIIHEEEKSAEYNLSLTVTPTGVPYLNLDVAPQAGTVPWFLSIDSTDSADTGSGGIVLYEYDLYGDGDFEYSSAFPGVRQYEILRVGTFNASVRITDTDGFQVTEHIQIVSSGPAGSEIEPNNDYENGQALELGVGDFFGDVGGSALSSDGKDVYTFTGTGVIFHSFSVTYDEEHGHLSLLLYRNDGGNWTYLEGSSTGSGLEYVDTLLQPDKEYQLQVVAVSGASQYEMEWSY